MNELEINYNIRNYYTDLDAKAISKTLESQTEIIEIMKKVSTASADEKKILREKLYELLSFKFEIMKTKGIFSFQFITTDNKSFLRMHKPDMFGDDLGKVRFSINKINKEHKHISGFEQGKVSHGFRNIFPLFDENKNYIGAYEVSYSTEHLQDVLTRINKMHSHFLINKDIFDSNVWSSEYLASSYTQSVENKDFLVITNNEDHKHNRDSLYESKLDSDDIEYVHSKMEDSKSFSIYSKVGKSVKVTAFLPIKNIKGDKTSAYLLSYTKNNYLYDILSNYRFINIITFISFAIILYLLYLQIVRNRKDELLNIQNTKFSVIGQMAAGITHEINTPLTYIKGTTEMSRYDLEDMPENDFKQRLLEDNEKVMNGIVRMGIIIESMREMSQISSDTKEDINIYATIITVLRMTYNRSKMVSKIYINDELFQLDSSDPHKYEYLGKGQKQRIEQVWTIIINNALDELVKVDDYEDRKIDIRIKKNNEKLTVSFEDNAGGIPDKIKDNLFDPFVSTKESSGIGIGLNVAKKIIEDHDATIYVKNKNGGACFVVEGL